MLILKKAFVLSSSQLSTKFRVENNNLDLSELMAKTGLRVCKVSDIAKAHRNDRDRKKTVDAEFRYVQISDIDVTLGRIKSYRTFRGSTAPNNARRIMNHGDVLVSTRRPTRGAVVAVPQEFDNHICTVFFTTLKVNDWNEVDPRYLALYLRTSIGRFQFSSMITETAYPVITEQDVEQMTVLLPDIKDQQEVADLYERAVVSFFDTLNKAHESITVARQGVENLVLRDFAETYASERFGIQSEEIVEDEEEESGEGNED